LRGKSKSREGIEAAEGSGAFHRCGSHHDMTVAATTARPWWPLAEAALLPRSAAFGALF